MTRAVVCKECADKIGPLHPEDAAMGFVRRIVSGIGKKPEGLEITVTTDDKVTRIPVPFLVCDYCNAGPLDGTRITCITMWRGDEPWPWEAEYLSEFDP